MFEFLGRLGISLVLLASVLPNGLAQEASRSETPATSIADIVGPTDGYGLVLTAGSDGKGSLEMCGCGRMPLGGLPRRVGYERAVLEGTGGQAGLLRVDAGGAFDDTVDTGRNEVIPHIRNEWVLRGYLARDFATINVALTDLGYLSQMNVRAGRETRVERFPMLDRVISANVVPTSDAIVPFQPFVIRSVNAPRLGPKPVRVAFVGVCQPSAKSDEIVHGYRIGDPVAAVRAVLPELRRKADVIVLLAYGSMGDARAIANAVPGIDIVFAANAILPDTETAGVTGKTQVVPVVIQARSLTEIRAARATSGAWTFAPRSVLLDSGIPNDPETLEMVYGARADYMR